MKYFFLLLLLGVSPALYAQTIIEDTSGHILARIAEDGTVKNSRSKVVGYFKANGVVRNAKSDLMGYILNNYSIEDSGNNTIGYVLDNGTVENSEHHTIGYVSAGYIENENAGNIGRYNKTGNIFWVAAYFFFFKLK